VPGGERGCPGKSPVCAAIEGVDHCVFALKFATLEADRITVDTPQPARGSGSKRSRSAALSDRSACRRSQSRCNPSQKSALMPVTRGESRRGVGGDAALSVDDLVQAGKGDPE
jgi:hypothetical protein